MKKQLEEKEVQIYDHREGYADNKRVAIIIINYNMLERANKLVEDIERVVKHPHDTILVDNASDIMEASEYTSIRLTKNVQTANGWMTGLAYADALEAMAIIFHPERFE